MIFAAALALVLPTSDAGSPLVRTAREECALLSHELGRSVSVSASLANEVIYVDSRGVPPRKELGAVATALHASVIERAGGIEIVRTQADLNELHTRRTAERLGWIERWRDRVHQFRKSQIASPTDAKAILAFANSEGQNLSDWAMGKVKDHQSLMLGPEKLLPSEPLVEGVMEKLGLANLASIPTGESELWESVPVAPTAKQLPDMSDLVSNYNAVEQVLSKTDISSATLNFLTMLGERAPWRAGSAPISRLRVRATALATRVEVRLEGADSGGRGSLTSTFAASTTDEWLSPKDVARRLHEQKIAEPIELSTGEADHLDVGQNRDGSPLPARMFNPEKFEPLGYMAAKAMSILSQQSPGGCFVADMPDGLDAYSEQAVTQNVFDLKQFEAIIHQKLPYEKVESNGSTVWRPLDPEAVEAERADRRVLGGFLRDAKDAEGFVPTHARAVALHAGKRALSPMALTWAYGTANRLPHAWQFPENINPQYLFLLGGIDSLGWQDLEDGRTLSAAELGIQEDLSRMIAADSFSLQFSDPSVPEIADHPSDILAGADVGDVRFAIRREHAGLSKIWPVGQKEPRPWTILHIEDLSQRGPCQAAWDASLNQSVVRTDRQTFESGLSRWSYRFAELNGGILVITFPHNATMQIPLAAPATEVTPQESYADFPDALKDEVWSSAQAIAIKGADSIRELMRRSGGG